MRSSGEGKTTDLQSRTIADFGEQWTAYSDAEGYFGSVELFDDTFQPLLTHRDLAGKRVVEIGAGTGRFISVIAAAGARHVIALEPSSAFEVLRSSTARYRDRITYLDVAGDRLPQTGDCDLVFMIGVLHHIVDPDPVVRACFGALRPGGELAVWVYGREGNGAYLFAARMVWWFTRRLPHRALAAFVALLYPLFWIYMTSSRWLPLPLGEYLRRVMVPLTGRKRRVVIYDQLNPAYARYYRRDELTEVLRRGGFTNIRLHHRHGYSWTAVATKPE